jgi:Anti-sigma factor NepR
MGVRSRLVLEKLGHDLRSYYEELLSAPLPAHLLEVLERAPARMPNIADGPGL